MLNPVNPLRNRRVPYASEALLHAVTLAEYRRQFMVQPSRIERAPQAVEAKRKDRDQTWRPALKPSPMPTSPGFASIADGWRASSVYMVPPSATSPGNLVARVAVTCPNRTPGRRRSPATRFPECRCTRSGHRMTAT